MSPIIVFLFTYFITLVASNTAQFYDLVQAENYFENFTRQYGKKYKDADEKNARFKIFKDNLVKVNLMNRRSKYAVYGITKFMDLTTEEALSKYTGFRKNLSRMPGECSMLSDVDVPDVKAPDSFDWRDHNAVTYVKDQGVCGSCYIFGSVGCIEGQYAIKYGKLVDFSEQQILDCDTLSYGCGGGYPSAVMRHICDFMDGLMTEADYPYAGHQYECKFNHDKVKVFLDTCHSYNLTSQEKLKQLLYSYGPISIAIRGYPLLYYLGGIISDEDCHIGGLNHATLLVGYGSENGTDYWIVKNSWGEIFGEQGYYRMQRGEGANSCGVMNREMVIAIIK